MMKKRNMALAMAAVTVAGTVAPAFAAETKTTQENITTKDYAGLESKIKNMLDMKYSNDAADLEDVTTGSSVYNVQVTEAGNTLNSAGLKSNTISNSAELKAVTDIINKSAKGTVFNFTITDNGHAAKSDGTLTNKGVNTYTNTDIVNADFAKQGLTFDAQGKAILKDKDGATTYNVTKKFDDAKLTQTLTFTNAKTTKVEFTLDLKAGEKKKNFEAPVFTGVELTGFQYKEEAIASTVQNISVANAEEEKLVVTAENAKTTAEQLNAKYIFADGAVTKAKNDIELVDGKYQTTLFAENIKVNTTTRSAKATTPEKTLAQIVLTSNTKAELETLLDAMIGNADFTTIAGVDRIDTAIQLSKKNFNIGTAPVAAQSAVLVGQYAIVDGLAAAPLAAKEEAPLLLTDSKTLSKEVKAELVRALGLKNTVNDNKGKTIYLVGGTTVISKDVELELAQMGVKVERVSGDDREATSREIAKKVNTRGEAFVVDGYKGLSDAMSISAVASMKKAPIVVVNGASQLNADAKTFLKGYNQAGVIGGDGVVSKDALSDIANATGNAKRISGTDRQETNAKVIEAYNKEFAKGSVYVAKDGYTGENQLVDALAAAPIAGNAKAPIVLATSTLTTDQAIAINNVKDTNANAKNKLTQVGGGVADSVINSVKKLLGL